MDENILFHCFNIFEFCFASTFLLLLFFCFFLCFFCSKYFYFFTLVMDYIFHLLIGFSKSHLNVKSAYFDLITSS